MYKLLVLDWRVSRGAAKVVVIIVKASTAGIEVRIVKL